MNDFGKQISKMLVDLTNSQAGGNEHTYCILKPLNELNCLNRAVNPLFTISY